IGLILLILTYFISRKRDYKGTDQPFEMKEFWSALLKSLWALGTPIILIGGVFSGIFTPTESGVIAVVYAIIVGMFIYRELTIKQIGRVVQNSAKTTATIMFIISNAYLFAYVLAYENIPETLVSGFLTVSENPLVILLIISLILLVFGMFMDTVAMLIIDVPMFLIVITTLC